MMMDWFSPAAAGAPSAWSFNFDECSRRMSALSKAGMTALSELDVTTAMSDLNLSEIHPFDEASFSHLLISSTNKQTLSFHVLAPPSFPSETATDTINSLQLHPITIDTEDILSLPLTQPPLHLAIKKLETSTDSLAEMRTINYRLNIVYKNQIDHIEFEVTYSTMKEAAEPTIIQNRSAFAAQDDQTCSSTHLIRISSSQLIQSHSFSSTTIIKQVIFDETSNDMIVITNDTQYSKILLIRSSSAPSLTPPVTVAQFDVALETLLDRVGATPGLTLIRALSKKREQASASTNISSSYFRSNGGIILHTYYLRADEQFQSHSRPLTSNISADWHSKQHSQLLFSFSGSYIAIQDEDCIEIQDFNNHTIKSISRSNQSSICVTANLNKTTFAVLSKERKPSSSSFEVNLYNYENPLSVLDSVQVPHELNCQGKVRLIISQSSHKQLRRQAPQSASDLDSNEGEASSLSVVQCQEQRSLILLLSESSNDTKKKEIIGILVDSKKLDAKVPFLKNVDSQVTNMNEESCFAMDLSWSNHEADSSSQRSVRQSPVRSIQSRLQQQFMYFDLFKTPERKKVPLFQLSSSLTAAQRNQANNLSNNVANSNSNFNIMHGIKNSRMLFSDNQSPRNPLQNSQLKKSARKQQTISSLQSQNIERSSSADQIDAATAICNGRREERSNAIMDLLQVQLDRDDFVKLEQESVNNTSNSKGIGSLESAEEQNREGEKRLRKPSWGTMARSTPEAKGTSSVATATAAVGSDDSVGKKLERWAMNAQNKNKVAVSKGKATSSGNTSQQQLQSSTSHNNISQVKKSLNNVFTLNNNSGQKQQQKEQKQVKVQQQQQQQSQQKCLTQMKLFVSEDHQLSIQSSAQLVASRNKQSTVSATITQPSESVDAFAKSPTASGSSPSNITGKRRSPLAMNTQIAGIEKEHTMSSGMEGRKIFQKS